MLRKFTPKTCLISVSAALLLAACGADNSATSAPNSASTPAPAAAPTQQVAAAADPLARGARLYKRCQTCHTLEQDGRHRVGPNMWNLFGSTADQREGFAYSKAMSESGIVWDEETLSAYIENPRKFMPGNRMSYAGLRKPEDRAAVLAYIKAKTSPE